MIVVVGLTVVAVVIMNAVYSFVAVVEEITPVVVFVMEQISFEQRYFAEELAPTNRFE